MPLNNEVTVLNIHNIDNDIKDEATRSMIAGEEKEAYATNDYLKDQYFIWNDRKLYKVTAPINHGDTFVVGGNIKYVGTLASEIYNLYISSAEGIKDLIGNVEEANASKAYYFGDYIILASDGLLYQVTTNVSMGTAWAVGTNIKFIDNVTTVITAIEQKLHKTQQMIAPVEPTNKASRSYEIGEQFIFQNELVEATVHIEQQQTIAKGTNCKKSVDIVSQVKEIESKIKSTPTNKKFILIGDSFGYGIIGDGSAWTTGWIDYLKNLYPDRVFAYDAERDPDFEGVAAFLGTVPWINLFDWVVENKLGDTTPDEITDVVVLGGNNEPADSYSQIKSHIKNVFVPHVREICPNASIRIGVVGLLADMLYERCYKAYKEGASESGAEFMGDLLNMGSMSQYNSEHGHWTAAGYAFYNPFIVHYVLFDKVDYSFTYYYLLEPTSDVTVLGNVDFRMNIQITPHAVYLTVYNTFKYGGWILQNAKAWSSGSIDVKMFKVVGNIHTQIINGSSPATSSYIINLPTGGIIGCGVMRLLHDETNGWYINNNGFINGNVTDHLNTNIAFVWDGTSKAYAEVIAE